MVTAAEREPERFAHLVEEMDRTGKVNGAFRKLRKAEDERRIQGLRPVQGKFRTLVIDPPWDYDWLSLTGRATPGYATMGHAELLALDVAAWAEEDCHLLDPQQLRDPRDGDSWRGGDSSTRQC